MLLAALLAGLVGGASLAEASIPQEQPQGVLHEQPVPLLEQEPLLEVPADEPPTTAATGGDSLPFFASGPGPEGLFDGVRIPAVERFQAETRYRVIELEIEIRAEMERLQTTDRTGLALFGGGETRRGSPNRYYDPELGRFISADPLGYVDGPSMYGFAGYSPMNFGDPLGLQSQEKQGSSWWDPFGWFGSGEEAKDRPSEKVKVRKWYRPIYIQVEPIKSSTAWEKEEIEFQLREANRILGDQAGVYVFWTRIKKDLDPKGALRTYPDSVDGFLSVTPPVVPWVVGRWERAS